MGCSYSPPKLAHFFLNHSVVSWSQTNWDRAIKLARWQHCAAGCGARSAVAGITWLVLHYSSENIQSKFVWHCASYSEHLSPSAMLERDIGITNMSVCPLHAGVESKLMIIGSCTFHHRLTPGLLGYDSWCQKTWVTVTPNPIKPNLENPTQACIHDHCKITSVRWCMWACCRPVAIAPVFWAT